MKRILSLLLALVIAISAAVPAYATGDGNFDGGGGSMGDGTKTNYWNPGMDGVRVSIVDVGSHSVVRTPIDLTNKGSCSKCCSLWKGVQVVLQCGTRIVRIGQWIFISKSESKLA
mgnify:CR=1 FL=1